MREKGRLYSKLYYIFLTLIIIAIVIVVIILYNTLKTTKSSFFDHYSDFNELKKNTHKNKDWRIDTKTRKNKKILVTAIHGGGIEPGTTEIARRISNVGKYNFFTFEDLRKSNNDQLHITSTHFSEPHLQKMLKDTKETISIHGFSGDNPIVYIGGKDKGMSKAIATQLRRKGFTVKESPENIDTQSSDNFVNKNESNSDVQLELTTALRKEFFKHYKLDRSTRSNTDKYTPEFYKFANSVQKGIEKAY
ncbi:poly-gamma-glutamate hydrolase family protein [Staphylococcus saccharolyticus]|uniref:poly-gamma-glutamate hydrolase family protein n=1 Tax=Staphylococcus saccharolyticus TaxID=33028 RepID=UPI00102D80A1|nr:poly-gamma-glutamate hydrolase family protein [Staphylococcus saccharolyticus]MBL7572777.1 poly-gamma-glutamate hydrolase family protein [Staphylococcus saccharolyticus]MBL7584287.1 poly-gamma-glutamate hydrolase family protein [Staphylococcus saccharolyticus]MBL7638394.1 poly-gamma-glutamate hydrolase family protein [Staphylococcus saccharolyticus]QRJ68101.1 poly-gamma-glutamate hydrolase family protein [Staphylococcus saccharolyticus]TAA93316.1 hypothetical protein DMB74_01455 [Staphyloco